MTVDPMAYEKLVEAIVGDFRSVPRVDRGDLLNEAWLALLGAIAAHRRLRPGRPFDAAYAASWIRRTIRGSIDRQMVKAVGFGRDGDDPTATIEAPDGRDDDGDGDDAGSMLGRLEPLQAEVLRLRLGLDGGDGASLRSVARMLHIAPSHVLKLERSALSGLRDDPACSRN